MNISSNINSIVTIFIPCLIAWLTSRATIRFERNKFEREFQLEFALEAAIKVLLSSDNYTMRSFTKIKHHLPGFSDDNELRRHLIQAGAVRFTSANGEEMWGLLEKHKGQAFQ